MFKLVLEKAEEPEIKLPTSAGPSIKQESSRKTSISALLTMLKPLTVDHNQLWKILKDMGIPDHLTCLLRNLYAGQEATVRTGHGTTDRFQVGQGVRQGCILSPCLFNFYAEYIMRNAWLDEAQAGIKIAGSFFCRSWCCLCARSVRTWYLFCEAAAEETPALAMVDEKPKEGVKAENNDHINLKVAGQDGSVVQFKIKRHTPLSKLMKAYCE